MSKINTDNKIDFVITWVDGNDPEWQEEFIKYKKLEGGDTRVNRFRDYGTLKYWFRAVEKYAPWVNNIYFITCGQCPEWLNTDNPKLKLINHRDYVPEEYLPTFSSLTIEWSFHRIEGLSEQFVYFNDDMFITAPTKPTDFFKNGRPRNSVIMDYTLPTSEPWYLRPTINAAVLNRNFNKREVVRKNFWKMFNPKNGIYVIKNFQFAFDNRIPGFIACHLPTNLLKSVFKKVVETEPQVIHDTCVNKFRKPIGVNQWLVKDWQTCMGLDIPKRFSEAHCFHFYKQSDLEKAVKAIKKQKYKIICMNDHIEDFDTAVVKLQEAFESIYPEKSSFEK